MHCTHLPPAVPARMHPVPPPAPAAVPLVVPPRGPRSTQHSERHFSNIGELYFF